MPKILVINAGSSSIKYKVFQLQKNNDKNKLVVICSGAITNFAYENCKIEYKVNSQVFTDSKTQINTIEDAISFIKNTLYPKQIISENETLHAIGHRVVHGGDSFSKPTLINNKNLKILENISYLAPLHNPANLAAIKLCEEYFKNVPQVAVFDTAFHQTIPEVAYRYPVPNELFEKDKIRVYGFHGTSHEYVSKQSIKFAKLNNKKYESIITLHLGNGCSMAAIKNGNCIDTTMGLTPLSGLMMGTRSGNIDPSLFDFLHRRKKMSVNDINNLLNKKSGLLGIAENSNMCIIEQQAIEGNKNAMLAIDMFVYRIIKTIGSYIAILNGIDILVFTAGIGENSNLIRQKICENLSAFNIFIDYNKNNNINENISQITKNNNEVETLVIKTNEEYAIAKQTLEITK